jgi:phosphatidylglycerol:prolipoprotein diacylglycerol transferase
MKEINYAAYINRKGIIMKNELLTIGPITLYGYGLMIAIGVIAAYMCAEYRAKRKGLDAETIFPLTLWCLAGGILGAKLLYYITQINEIIADPKVLLDVSNGFVVYGGIIGGILAGFLFCKKKKLPFLKYFDLVMPSIALAQGFGRIGCVFAGCCYGEETNSAFHIIFQESAYAPNNLQLIPTQPIASLLDFLHFFVLIFLAKRVKADGQIAGFYLIFYSAGRFILEFFRGDLVRGSVGILSTSQFIAIFLFVIGFAIVIVRGFHSRKDSKVQE